MLCRTSAFMTPSVTISSRGEDRLRSGHPWIYRADVTDVRAAAGDVVLVRGPRGRPIGRALFSDRSQITLRMLAYAADEVDVERAAAHANRSGRGVSRVAGDRRDRLPAGAWRGGSAAVADRGSVRRLPGRPDAVAGHGSAAAGDRVDPRRRRAPARHPGAQRSARARVLEGLRAAGRRAGRRRARARGGDRGRRHLRRRSAARAEDRPVSRPARKPDGGGRLRARAGCSTVSAITAGLPWCWAGGASETIAIDVSGDAIARADRECRAQRRRRSRLASATSSTNCAASNVFTSGFDTIVLDPPAFAKNKRRRCERPGRLQGNQPARVEAPEPWRHARDVQLFLSRERGDVRGDRACRPPSTRRPTSR